MRKIIFSHFLTLFGPLNFVIFSFYLLDKSTYSFYLSEKCAFISFSNKLYFYFLNTHYLKSITYLFD